MRRWLSLAILVLVAACSDRPRSDSPGSASASSTSTTGGSGFVPTTEPGVGRNVAREIAAEIGCEVLQEVGREDYPIRGGAAVRGVTCSISGTLIDVFERSQSIGDRGGALENIHRTVGATPGISDACGWLSVGETWFLVTRDRELLEDVSNTLGEGVVADIIPVSPVVSYAVPGTANCTA